MNKQIEILVKDILKSLSFYSVEAAPEDGAPFGRANRGVLDFVLQRCLDFGFSTKNLDGYCGYADIGEGEPFGILGHLDVMPIGKGWTKNPYGEISNGTIYGRGVMDDKGPMLVALHAVNALLSEGKKPKYKIRFIFGSNEESGWKCIEHYNKCEKMPDIGISPDADFPVINCEKGIMHLSLTTDYDGVFKINAGERPNVVPSECTVIASQSTDLSDFIKDDSFTLSKENGVQTLTALGVNAHAATPWLGDNAIVKMLSAIGNREPLFKMLSQKFASYDGKGCGLNLCDEASGSLTLNVGMISTEKGKLSLVLDIRYPVTIPEEKLKSIITNQFPEFSLNVFNVQKPLYVDKNNFLVTTLLNAYNRVTGQNAEAITIGGGTYARALKSGVAFGPELPGRPSTIHQPDERVAISDLELIYKIYYEAFKDLLFF